MIYHPNVNAKYKVITNMTYEMMWIYLPFHELECIVYTHAHFMSLRSILKWLVTTYKIRRLINILHVISSN